MYRLVNISINGDSDSVLAILLQYQYWYYWYFYAEVIEAVSLILFKCQSILPIVVHKKCRNRCLFSVQSKYIGSLSAVNYYLVTVERFYYLQQLSLPKYYPTIAPQSRGCTSLLPLDCCRAAFLIGWSCFIKHEFWIANVSNNGQILSIHEH